MRAVGVRPAVAGPLAGAWATLRLATPVWPGPISNSLPSPAEILKEAVVARFRERKPALVAVNEQAFEAGRAAQAAT